MHQTAKGKQWYFGMKAHIGVDSKTKLIHTILASAANVPDSLALPHLLHGRETRVYGDHEHPGQTDVIRKVAPKVAHFRLLPGGDPHDRLVSFAKSDRRPAVH